MRLPSKVTSFNESILPNALIILKKIKNGEKSVLNLQRYANDICEFFSILELLYSIGAIGLNEKKELYYVG